MRNLSKVIFINSASMRYAEMVLDGNIHLAGKPGVGKTTLQRAVLYFFTANQLRLGIDPSKQRFMQFYLPERASHIVYEFKKDESSFCVILIDSGHGIQYGFVDAPYCVDWIIDPVTGVCAEMWSDITKNIPRHIDRDLVTSIKDYLAILWGTNRDRRYARYAIAESKGYENIIKSLQNIFLNSGFSIPSFKTNLVMQLEDVRPSINLAQLRSRLEDFEVITHDISLWSQVCSEGENETKRLSGEITSDYYSYIETVRQMREFLAQLYLAVKKSNDSLPGKEEEYAKLASDAEAIKTEIASISEQYALQEESLKAKIAIKENLLVTIEEKKQQYKDIDFVIKEVSEKPALEKERISLDNQLASLRQENMSIESKYAGILNDLKEGHLKIIEEISKSVDRRKEQFDIEKKNIDSQREKSLDSIREDYSSRLGKIAERIKSLNAQLLENTGNLATINATVFYADEVQAKRNEITSLKLELSSISNELSNIKHSLESKRKEGLGEENRINNQFTEEKEKADMETSVIDTRLAEIESLLSKYDDSFYSWLQANMTDCWQDTIGKVVNETILYRTDLQPELTGATDSASLYGVRLMTENIENQSLSPADYERERQELVSRKEIISKDLHVKAVKRNEDLEENKKKYAKILSELREAIAKKDVESNGKSMRINSLKSEIYTLEEKAVEEKNRQVDSLTKEISKIKDDISEKEQHGKSVNAEMETSLKGVEEWYKDSVAALEKGRNDFIEEKSRMKAEEDKKYISQKEEYIRQKQEELSGNKVDVSRIKGLESRIENIDKTLSILSEKESFVLYYQKDKEEFLDHEQEYRIEVKSLQNNVSVISDECKSKTESKNKDLKGVNALMSKLNDSIVEIRAGLARFEQERKFLPVLRYDEQTVAGETDASVSHLLESYNNARNEKRDLYVALKKGTDMFRKKFLGNIFNLPVKLDLEEDYLKYAKELTNIINFSLIDKYRITQKDIYIRTLTGIRLSMDDLKRDMNLVKGKVAEIDNEFKKAKMPDVIKELRLRTTDTRDDLYECLLRIREFVAINENMLAGIDLFTSESDFDKVRDEMFDLLSTFIDILNRPGYLDRNEFTLEDMFDVEVKVTENGNTYDWTTGLSGMIGSTATDIMVKMLLNTVLVSISMNKAIKDGGLYLHCIVCIIQSSLF